MYNSKRMDPNNDRDSVQGLFQTFSTASTLHGVYYLGSSQRWYSRFLWLFIVVIGLLFSVICIEECFRGWQQNPVVTAVWQVPIQAIPFPSITICPKGNKRFGFLKDEMTTNEHVVVPTCKYNDKIGTNIAGYNQTYCDESVFQPTFNEYGMCYTFNNRRQGMDKYFSSRQFAIDKEDIRQDMNSTKRNIDFVSHHSLEIDEKEIFKVRGCGKDSGFQLTLDTRGHFSNQGISESIELGFQVFITLNGVVTSHVPYFVSAGFNGEHNFYLHGIHNIVAGKDFRGWQKLNQICYFPHQKALDFFKSYSQDNCLLECRIKKIATRCKCAPWFIPRVENRNTSLSDLPECGDEGDTCFKEISTAYDEDLTDRTTCDCKNDCEMVHSFSTLQREPFANNIGGHREWSQQLNEYLFDTKNKLINRNLKDQAKVQHNLTSDEELAQARLQKDFIFLNFFFDTQIITQITLEMRVSTFDKLSLIGGTMGLFTGISIITLIEMVWWVIKFITLAIQQKIGKKHVEKVSPIDNMYKERM